MDVDYQHALKEPWLKPRLDPSTKKVK
jgi:hypothetical protein